MEDNARGDERLADLREVVEDEPAPGALPVEDDVRGVERERRRDVRDDARERLDGGAVRELLVVDVARVLVRKDVEVHQLRELREPLLEHVEALERVVAEDDDPPPRAGHRRPRLGRLRHVVDRRPARERLAPRERLVLVDGRPPPLRPLLQRGRNLRSKPRRRHKLLRVPVCAHWSEPPAPPVFLQAGRGACCLISACPKNRFEKRAMWPIPNPLQKPFALILNHDKTNHLLFIGE